MILVDFAAAYSTTTINDNNKNKNNDNYYYYYTINTDCLGPISLSLNAVSWNQLFFPMWLSS